MLCNYSDGVLCTRGNYVRVTIDNGNYGIMTTVTMVLVCSV